MYYWAVWQVIGRDFSENTPGVASLALAVGSSAGWLVHDASSISKHTKIFPYNLPVRLVQGASNLRSQLRDHT